MATDGAASDAGSKKKLLIFDSEEDLAVSLAKYTAELSEKFAAERGAFTAVLSGGSLIQALRFFNFPCTLRD
jgi:6-phosphogluconolactonase